MRSEIKSTRTRHQESILTTQKEQDIAALPMNAVTDKLQVIRTNNIAA